MLARKVSQAYMKWDLESKPPNLMYLRSRVQKIQDTSSSSLSYKPLLAEILMNPCEFHLEKEKKELSLR